MIDVDELWMSIETDSGIKCTRGTIYRRTKANLTKFNDRLYAAPQTIYSSGKSIDMKYICYVAGYFNVILTNFDLHNPTKTFINPCSV